MSAALNIPNPTPPALTVVPPSPAADRLRSIGAMIVGALRSVNDDSEAATDARNAATAAGETLASTRETTLAALAVLSRDNQWSASDVLAGAKLAVDQSPADKQKAVATYIGQCKVAMNPKVRSHVADIFATCGAAWDAEAAMLKLSKDHDAPIKRAFARRYHLMCQALNEASEGNVISDAAEVVAWAERKDPNLDPEKQAKAIKTAMNHLLDIAANFPDEDIQGAADLLAKVTEHTLKAARAAIMAAMVGATVAEPVVEAAQPEAVVATVSPAEEIDSLMDGLPVG